MNNSLLAAASSAALAWHSGAAPAQAQPKSDYPNRPVRIAVAGPPGSSNDITVRAMAQRFTQAWGQQMVLDNRPGGAGIIAHEIAVRANPDGYTLVFSSSSGLVINPLLFKMLYDPIRDLAPISLGSINPQLLFANPSVAAKSVPELIALAKAKPGTLNCASAGNGTPNHLGCELLISLGNLNFVHVPYKGSGPGIVDVVAGQAYFMFASIPQVLPLVRTNKLRALGIGSLKRSSVAPDVATISETLPGFEYENWYAMLAPAGTPAPIVNKINADGKDDRRSRVHAAPAGTGLRAAIQHARRADGTHAQGVGALGARHQVGGDQDRALITAAPRDSYRRCLIASTA